MFLNNDEIQMLERLGLRLQDEQIKVASTLSNMIYCGLNIYTNLNGELFEKLAYGLEEVTSDEIEAEKRFISRHRLKD